jgi:hypothetical protein
MAETTAEPSKSPADVTRVPLDTLRSSGVVGVARRTADELVNGRPMTQDQNAEQFSPEAIDGVSG